MTITCGDCKYFREKNGEAHCWITAKTISVDTPICDFNFKPKDEEK